MSDTEYNLSYLRWRCRRGTKELDIVMNRYLNEHFEAAADSDKAAFVSLLDYEDPVLYDWIIDHGLVSDDVALNRVLAVIRTK